MSFLVDNTLFVRNGTPAALLIDEVFLGRAPDERDAVTPIPDNTLIWCKELESMEDRIITIYPSGSVYWSAYIRFSNVEIETAFPVTEGMLTDIAFPSRGE